MAFQGITHMAPAGRDPLGTLHRLRRPDLPSGSLTRLPPASLAASRSSCPSSRSGSHHQVGTPPTSAARSTPSSVSVAGWMFFLCNPVCSDSLHRHHQRLRRVYVPGPSAGHELPWWACSVHRSAARASGGLAFLGVNRRSPRRSLSRSWIASRSRLPADLLRRGVVSGLVRGRGSRSRDPGDNPGARLLLAIVFSVLSSRLRAGARPFAWRHATGDAPSPSRPSSGTALIIVSAPGWCSASSGAGFRDQQGRVPTAIREQPVLHDHRVTRAWAAPERSSSSSP